MPLHICMTTETNVVTYTSSLELGQYLSGAYGTSEAMKKLPGIQKDQDAILLFGERTSLMLFMVFMMMMMVCPPAV